MEHLMDGPTGTAQGERQLVPNRPLHKLYIYLMGNVNAPGSKLSEGCKGKICTDIRSIAFLLFALNCSAQKAALSFISVPLAC